MCDRIRKKRGVKARKSGEYMDFFECGQDVGIDVAYVSDFIGCDEKAKYVLSEEEEKIYFSLCEERKPVYLASRWALKEALFKITQNPEYTAYAFLNDERGKPYLKDHPDFRASVSHERDLVIAIVLKVKISGE